jgi:malonate-semialdehyde dehydrogenase (acetylating)/methylmalonate-semialdehyde dehydrogenase
VNFITDELKIKVISFVSSDKAGKYIYSRGSVLGKHVQANARYLTPPND